MTEPLTPLISTFFHIEDITSGEEREGYLLRYRGHMLHEDTPAAFDLLYDAARPLGLTPLFRVEEKTGRHIIYLARGVIEPTPSNPTVNLVLLALTILSVMFTGAQVPPETPAPADFLGQILLIGQYIFTGWPFALALLSILGAHELGHYFAGRWHKVNVTLPYFIPLPLSLLGTMGAFIQMKDIPKNKRHLFDIGIAGPLAGLVVAIPVLILGLSLSQLGPVEPSPGGFIEGNSLLYLAAKYLVFGQLLPTPIDYAGLPPALYWLTYFFTGAPIPYGGLDVFIHPVALAGWAGILVTALNLIPAGQLDGGHILYALFGKNVRRALPAIFVFLIIMGWFWSGWWLWAGLLFLVGRTSAEPLDQITELDPRRRALGVLAILIFLLVFTPVPIMSM